jgi:hypothetical protein
VPRHSPIGDSRSNQRRAARQNNKDTAVDLLILVDVVIPIRNLRPDSVTQLQLTKSDELFNGKRWFLVVDKRKAPSYMEIWRKR